MSKHPFRKYSFLKLKKLNIIEKVVTISFSHRSLINYLIEIENHKLRISLMNLKFVSKWIVYEIL